MLKTQLKGGWPIKLWHAAIYVSHPSPCEEGNRGWSVLRSAGDRVGKWVCALTINLATWRKGDTVKRLTFIFPKINLALSWSSGIFWSNTKDSTTNPRWSLCAWPSWLPNSKSEYRCPETGNCWWCGPTDGASVTGSLQEKETKTSSKSFPKHTPSVLVSKGRNHYVLRKTNSVNHIIAQSPYPKQNLNVSKIG